MRKPTTMEWLTGSGALVVLGALFTHWATVQAIANSKFPTASQDQVAQLAAQVQTLGAQLQINSAQLIQAQRQGDEMEQESLQRDLDRMTAQKADVTDRRKVVDQINVIRVRLGLPPIARP